ncbi:MAG: GNAT family N-acetyltransferase [Actinomycetales bacterium]|nr:GNAT family N-acetyltransferase [Actinomycetales bacterium]
MTDHSPAADLARAEQRAGVAIRLATDLSDLDIARRIFDVVWPSADGATQIPSNLMRALVHAGGYASVAYLDEVPVAAALGFVGRHRTGDGWHDHLHSHMAAVLEPHRDRHIGSAIKLHQRAWALDSGLDTIVWTFDPLVRRNARLNLLKLGVDVHGFEADFYGSMDDGINSGDPTDRLFAWWRLDSPRAYAALAGRFEPLDLLELAEAGRDVVEIDLPDDIVRLRAEAPAEAGRWRLDLRAALQEAFAAGYRIIGVSVADGYILERTP